MMVYNCVFETAIQYPIYDYLGSLYSPVIDATALNSAFVVRVVLLLNIPSTIGNNFLEYLKQWQDFRYLCASIITYN